MKSEREWVNILFGVLLAAAVSLNGWALHKMSLLGESQADTNAAVKYGRDARLKAEEQNAKDHRLLLDKLDAMLPRTEHELRYANLDTALKGLQAELYDIRTRISSIESRIAVIEKPAPRPN